jgi:hypothetical protein
MQQVTLAFEHDEPAPHGPPIAAEQVSVGRMPAGRSAAPAASVGNHTAERQKAASALPFRLTRVVGCQAGDRVWNVVAILRAIQQVERVRRGHQHPEGDYIQPEAGTSPIESHGALRDVQLQHD